MNQTLAISLNKPAITTESGLFIEQQQYGRTDGVLSRAGLHRAIIDLLDDEVVEEPICYDDCRTEVYVYRYDLGINYTLHASHGELGERIVEDELTFTEKLKLSMDDTAGLRYPFFGLVDWLWLGEKVWDMDGNEIPPPDFEIINNSVKFARPVYGTLVPQYRINRDRYGLLLPNRETALENKYSSVVYALHNTGPTWKTIDPPPSAEEFSKQCTGGGGIMPDYDPPKDDPTPPTAPHRDAKEVRDYCSQEVISDTSK